MNAGVQAGLVQLGLAGLLVVTWYTGAWQVIVDELAAGISGSGGRRFSPAGAAVAGVPFAPTPPPVGLRVPYAPRGVL